MPMQRLMVWDPGETTGYASFTFDDKTLRLLGSREIPYDPKFFATWYQGKKDIPHPTFVIEIFRLFSAHSVDHLHEGDEFPAAVSRGRIETVGALMNATIVYQQPSMMKEISEELLLRKIIGLNELPPGEHRKDALKHGLYWWLRHTHPSGR